jgi:hypothetical protein
MLSNFADDFPIETESATDANDMVIWTDITPDSHTLTEAHDIGNGVMKSYVVSHTIRRSRANARIW